MADAFTISMKTLKLGSSVDFFNKLTNSNDSGTVIDFNKHTVSVITQNDEIIEVSLKDTLVLDEVA